MHVAAKKNFDLRILLPFVILGLVLILYSFNIYADTSKDLGFDIGGTDKSSSFPVLTNIFHTVGVFAVQYIARIVGACLIIYGFFTAALKDKLVGCIAAFFGAVLLFLPTIIQEFIKFGTT